MEALLVDLFQDALAILAIHQNAIREDFDTFTERRQLLC